MRPQNNNKNRPWVGAAAAVSLLYGISPSWGGEIYSFTDDEGVLHLTDRPNDRRYRPVARYNNYQVRVTRSGNPVIYWSAVPSRSAPPVSWRSSGHRKQKKPQPFEEMVRRTARRTGLSKALLHSIIRAESNFNPDAVSAKGAQGLMQLMPATARHYGVTDSTDPASNMDAGARFMVDLLKQFKYNLKLSLAAYNAGPTAVSKYGGRMPPYPETQRYVKRVLRYYREYQQVM